MRNFLWEGIDKKGGAHLIRWDLATLPHAMGGLGIGRLRDTNMALLSKWLWRYLKEPGSFWRAVIDARYKATNRIIFPYKSQGRTFSKSLWSQIVCCGGLILPNIKRRINSGRNTLFWLDDWTDDGIFKLKFPRFFALSLKPTCSVLEAWNVSLGCWNIFPKRSLFYREVERWQSISQLWPQPRKTVSDDMWMWKLESNGNFSIKSVKKFLSIDRMRPICQNMDKIWSSFIPKKCKFFWWTLMLRSINTSEKIQARRPDCALSPNWCYLCNKASESVDHLFIHCTETSYYRAIISTAANLPLNGFSRIEQFMEFWLTIPQTSTKKHLVFQLNGLSYLAHMAGAKQQTLHG